MKKVISNAGGLTSTVVYLYDGQKIVETRNGSSAVVQQFLHGTQYIDELVMVRVKDKGDLYVHQDANWNVIGLTDLGRHVVERYVYTPYGELLVNQGERDQGGSVNAFGDRDGDNDVDATDKGTVGVTCTGTVSGSCRILDVDFDGDYDSTDATKFDALPQGLARRPRLPAHPRPLRPRRRDRAAFPGRRRPSVANAPTPRARAAPWPGLAPIPDRVPVAGRGRPRGPERGSAGRDPRRAGRTTAGQRRTVRRFDSRTNTLYLAISASRRLYATCPHHKRSPRSATKRTAHPTTMRFNHA